MIGRCKPTIQVFKELAGFVMAFELWAPPQLSSHDVATKANEWIQKHPDKPPFVRFLQDYVSSAWPCLWHGKIPYTVSFVDDCVVGISKTNADGEICAICHNDLGAGTEKLQCGHTFHTMCIQQWLRRAVTCPVCRASVHG